MMRGVGVCVEFLDKSKLDQRWKHPHDSRVDDDSDVCV